MKKFIFRTLTLVISTIAFLNAADQISATSKSESAVTKSARDLPRDLPSATKVIFSQDVLGDSVFTEEFPDFAACAAAAKKTLAPTVCEETGADTDVDTADVGD